jgi:hypothetical protein
MMFEPPYVVQAEAAVFTARDFDQLAFMEGHWGGTQPDGAPFFQLVERADATTFRSFSYPTSAFDTPTDSSTITFENGRIIARMGDWSWRIVRVTADLIELEPISAPARVSWRRMDAHTLKIVQGGTDTQGRPQQTVLTLEKLIPVVQAP